MLKIDRLRMNLGSRILENSDPLIFNDSSITFVKGESGIGKTTLLYLIGQLSSKHEVQYTYNNKEIYRKNKENFRKNYVGMLYQNFNMIDNLSLYENLVLFANINSREMDISRAKELLSYFSLDVPVQRKFSTLSGGEKQRFCLACLLAKDPKIIIADEPTSALDEENANGLMEVLFRLAKEKGKIVIVSTHSTKYDSKADNIIHLNRRGIVQSSIKEEKKVLNKIDIYRKLNPKFYYNMIKYRLNEMKNNNKFISIFLILAIAISVFLYQYSQAGVEQYKQLFKESLQSEVYLSPTSTSSVLSEDNLLYIRNIPGVSDIHQLKRTYGVIDINGVKEPLEIYSFYPFQGQLLDNMCYSNNNLIDYLGDKIDVTVGDYNKTFVIDKVLTPTKTLMYSTSSTKKIFIPNQEFTNFAYENINSYVLEINDFSQYNQIAEKIRVINSEYQCESTYKHFQTLINSQVSQQKYIYFTCALLLIISFLLFIIIQFNEVMSKKREMCVFQANGISKKHIFILEMCEYIVKLVIYFCLSMICSICFVKIYNLMNIATVDVSINLIYFVYIFLVNFLFIFIPSLISVYYFLKQSPEDELRALL